MNSPRTTTLQVLEVKGKAALDQFIRVPWGIYRDDPNWVPPLMIERRDALGAKNPFFEHAEWCAWMAFRDGVPVGRISAQVDRLFLETQHESTGFFGLIEAPDDPEVFSALFAAAESWLKLRGMTRVLGPFNLGINQEVGILVDGFDSPPFIMMGHAPRYYAAALERLGYHAEQDMLAYLLPTLQFGMPPAMQTLLRRQAQRINARSFRRSRREEELETMREIFNDAWQDNWGFVPFTRAEFQAVGKELLMLVPDEYIRIAEVDGEPAAFIVMLPNVNEVISDLDGRLLPFGWLKMIWRLKVRSVKTARVALMGVLKKYQNTRLGPALAFLIIGGLEVPGKGRGLEQVELSWVLEGNQGMRNIAEQIGGRVSKRYRMYGKALG